MNEALATLINPNHYQIIAHKQQKNSTSDPITKRYLPANIYNLARIRADYGANESSIFDTDNNGSFNTMDLLQWLPAWGATFANPQSVVTLFNRLQLDDFTFGEGVQFLAPIADDSNIQLAIVHKKLFGDDLGKPNDTWDLAHFTLEILYTDGEAHTYTFLRR